MVAITVTAITRDDKSPRRSTQANKRGLRGAAGGTYIGPVRPNSTSHGATAGYTGGGTEDTNGFRESDNYAADGNTGGFTGGASATVTRQAGAGTTRSAFLAPGVQGGSSISTTAGAAVIDSTGRAVDTGLDRFGRTLAGATSGRYTYTNFDGRSTLDGDGGRSVSIRGGTKASGTGPADAVTGETIATVPAGATRPTLGTAADGAAGTVNVVGGAGKVQVDLDANDITGGAGGRKGAEITLFKRRTDTDEDYDLVAVFTADGGTDITDAVTGLTAGTYAFYARWLLANQSRFSKSFYGPTILSRGPRSARATVTVT